MFNQKLSFIVIFLMWIKFRPMMTLMNATMMKAVEAADRCEAKAKGQRKTGLCLHSWPELVATLRSWASTRDSEKLSTMLSCATACLLRYLHFLHLSNCLACACLLVYLQPTSHLVIFYQISIRITERGVNTCDILLQNFCVSSNCLKRSS